MAQAKLIVLVALTVLLPEWISGGPARSRPEAIGAAERRDIPVVFALDPRLSEQHLWRRELNHGLGEATQVLGRRLGARFVLDGVVAWRPVGGSLGGLLDSLRVQAPPAVGRIVIGLAGGGEEGAVHGLAAYRDGSLVVVVPGGGELMRKGDPGAWRRVLTHELAHLFGAIHVARGTSLLSPDSPNLVLDEMNAGLVELHRHRRLAPHLYPLPPESLDAAVALYEEAAREAPLEAGVHLAQLALERGRPEAALQNAERVLSASTPSTDPTTAEAHNLRGIALRRLGRPQEAVAAYAEALARRPRHAPYHYNLAIALDRLGETERSLTAYERAVELDPAHVNALGNLARLMARQGEPERGVEYARQALRIAPDFTEARVNLALALLESGEQEAAEQEARRAVTERADLPSAHEVLGGVLLVRGQLREAAAAFEQAAALEPGEPRFRRNLAVALLGLGRQQRSLEDDAALTTLERAAAADSTNADVVSELADLRFERGFARPAAEAYRQLLALRPDDPAAHNNLAVLLFRAGDVAGARRHVDAARRLGLAVHPEFLKALDAAERH